MFGAKVQGHSRSMEELRSLPGEAVPKHNISINLKHICDATIDTGNHLSRKEERTSLTTIQRALV